MVGLTPPNTFKWEAGNIESGQGMFSCRNIYFAIMRESFVDCTFSLNEKWLQLGTF
jgi:hypothetical protein